MQDIKQDSNDVEAIIASLYFLRGVLTPVDQIFSYIKSELNKLIVAPFDSRKAVAISDQRLLYERFGNNPLHAWQAFEIWHESSLKEPPQWAVLVLAKSARGMTALGTTDGTLDSSIKKALNIDGHKVSQFKHNMFWLEVFHEVDSLVAQGIAQMAAFLQVAEKHHGKAGSWRNVEKNYFAFRAKLEGVGFAHPFDP